MKIIQSCPFHLTDNSTRILWEITSSCNLKCKHCLYYFSASKVEKDLSVNEIFKIIDKIKEDKSINAIWISGGEPLLRDNLLRVINKISSCNIKPSLSTNGTLISAEFAVQLHNNGVDYVHLSIDGVTPEVHDSLRGVPGAFDAVMNAVDYLNNAGISVGATFIVTEESINSVAEMIRLAVSKKIKVLSFYLVAPIGRGRDIVTSTKQELMSRLNETIENSVSFYSSEVKIEVFRTLPADDDGYLKSCKGYNFLTITNSGELGACPWFIKSQDILPKVSLTDTSFLEAKTIVQNSMKEYLSKRTNNLHVCRTCNHDDYCGRGCPAISGSDHVDPLCKYSR
jgi:radical SAM protein with 4Fe4S-binding SPASM domain